jgi:hypothetical protein
MTFQRLVDRTSEAVQSFEYCDLPNMLEFRTGGDAYRDARHVHAKRFDKYGKIEVNLAKNTHGGWVRASDKHDTF